MTDYRLRFLRRLGVAGARHQFRTDGSIQDLVQHGAGFAAYPLGYEMACRSLDARPQAQQDLLHGQPLKSREALVQFAEVAAGLPGVADALQECRKQGKMAPLYDYRLKVARNPKTPVKPVNDLLKLLGLPEQPAEGAR